MKFGNSKVMATIMALAMATGFTGCSKDENSSVQSDSDTEKDLLTSSSSIDIWSAQESIDSSLNSHDTSKPIEPNENGADASVSDDGVTSDNDTTSGDSSANSSTSSDDNIPSGTTFSPNDLAAARESNVRTNPNYDQYEEYPKNVGNSKPNYTPTGSVREGDWIWMTGENEWWYDPEHGYLTDAGMAKSAEDSHKIFYENPTWTEILGDLTREELEDILAGF